MVTLSDKLLKDYNAAKATKEQLLKEVVSGKPVKQNFLNAMITEAALEQQLEGLKLQAEKLLDAITPNEENSK